MSILIRSFSQKICLTSYQRCISTTTPLSLDKKWRRSRGLPLNPNEYGPLTNLPDYTFMDGRPTPVGLNMMRRLQRQEESAQEMVEKIREVDFAKERYARLQREKVENREKIIGGKLKPKGHLLLKS